VGDGRHRDLPGDQSDIRAGVRGHRRRASRCDTRDPRDVELAEHRLELPSALVMDRAVREPRDVGSEPAERTGRRIRFGNEEPRIGEDPPSVGAVGDRGHTRTVVPASDD
jgi:hypothetical protein